MIEFMEAHPIVMIAGVAIIIGLLQLAAVKIQNVGEHND